MPITLKDIAHELNLSVGTISKVLNQRPGIAVTEETRSRILETAKRLGYRPNAAARALRMGKTGVVSLVFSSSRVPFGISEILAERLSAQHYDLIVKVFASQTLLLEGLELLARSQSSDVALLWGRETEAEEQGELLQARGMTFIAKGRHEEHHPGWYQADFDHEGMMERAALRFVRQGHHRIAYLGYDVDEAFRHRLREGYLRAMRDLLDQSPPEGFVAEGPATVAFNANQVARWLELPIKERPTALIIGSGNKAWEGAELALARKGLKIGEGEGEFPVTGIADPGLALPMGSASAFQGFENRELAVILYDDLLLPILEGRKPNQTVVRFLPELSPLPPPRFATFPATLAPILPVESQ